MPRKREKPTSKEIYHLWWEYLRRSESYRKWCERNKSEPAQWRFPMPVERLKFFFPYLSWLDIFDKSFEEWWNSFIFGKLRNAKIEEYSKAGFGLDFDIRSTYRQLISDPNREEPSIKDFMEQFKENFAIREIFLPVFTVNVLSDVSIKQHMKEFGEIIERKREEAIRMIKKIRKGGWSLWKYPDWAYPTHPIRFEEIKRYLQIYDLRKEGSGWPEIAAKVYLRKVTDGKPLCDDLRTVLIKEKKAQKIIKNAEGGISPGKY